MRTIALLLLLVFSAVLPQNVSADDIYVVTSSKKLNVRNKPSKTGGIITQLSPGQEVICIGTNGSWKQIRLDNGRQGYASAEFLSYRRPVQQQINSAPSKSKENGGWWTTPTGMIIILILVSFAISQLLIFFDVENLFGLLIIAITSGSYIGGIVGLFSWWIFDNFRTPYLVVGGIWSLFLIIKLFSSYFKSAPSNDFDSSDWIDYASGGSSSSPSISYSPSSHSRNYDDDDDDWQQRQEEQKRQQREAESSSYLRTADEYYSKYEYCKRLAEEAESSADTEERYADDYEWRAREFNDSSYASQASECRSKASRYRYKAQQHTSEAERYYDLYREYQDKAR